MADICLKALCQRRLLFDASRVFQCLKLLRNAMASSQEPKSTEDSGSAQSPVGELSLDNEVAMSDGGEEPPADTEHANSPNDETNYLMNQAENNGRDHSQADPEITQETSGQHQTASFDQLPVDKQKILSMIIERMNTVRKFSEEWFQLKKGEIRLRKEMAMEDGEDSQDSRETQTKQIEPSADNELGHNHDEPNCSMIQSPLGEDNASELLRLGGPEIFHEASGPINTTSFEHSVGDEKKKQLGRGNFRGTLEIIHCDTGPVAPMSFQQSSSGKKMPDESQTIRHGGPEIIQVIDEPAVPSSFEQTIAAKMRHDYQETNHNSFDCCDESISHPSRNDIEEGVLQARRIGQSSEQNTPAIELATQNDVISTPTPIEEAVNLAEVERHVVEAQDSLPNITEAYLVDDGSVVIAKPKVPWWKQKRTKVLLGFILILIVTVLATSLKFALAPTTVTEIVNITASLIPSPQPSSAPSFSQMPSLVPSKCSEKVITNMRQIDLSSLDPLKPKIAIDGDNLVIAWVKPSAVFSFTGSLYIEVEGNLSISYLSNNNTLKISLE